MWDSICGNIRLFLKRILFLYHVFKYILLVHIFNRHFTCLLIAFEQITLLSFVLSDYFLVPFLCSIVESVMKRTCIILIIMTTTTRTIKIIIPAELLGHLRHTDYFVI